MVRNGVGGGINGAGTVFSLPLFGLPKRLELGRRQATGRLSPTGKRDAYRMDLQASFGNAITAPRSIAVDTAVTLGTLTFNSSQSYTIAGPQADYPPGQRGDAALNVSRQPPDFRALVLASTTDVTVSNSTDTLTISGSISGPGMALNMNGAGTLVLGGANTYSGGTTSAAGHLTLAHPLAVQNSTVSMTASGCLAFAAGVTSPVLGGLTGAGNIALATAASRPSRSNVGDNGQSTTYGGVLSGAGGLIKQGAGTLTLDRSQHLQRSHGHQPAGCFNCQAAVIGGSIGVHFVGNGSSVTGSAGVVAMSNWNNESGYTFSGSTLVEQQRPKQRGDVFTQRRRQRLGDRQCQPVAERLRL